MDAANAIKTALDESKVSYTQPRPGAFLVRLPGVHKLATMCWLVVSEHALLIEAFVMRRAEERREELYGFLLQRNARLYGVAFSIDPSGDVYLVGRRPLELVTGEEVDRLLGAVLAAADDNFDRMLEIGYGDAIRREWEWRVSRGESVANLQAFGRFAAPSDSAER